MESDYRPTPIPEKRTWIFVVLRGGVFVSPHSSLAHALREAQAYQGARHLEWTAVNTEPGAESWTDQQKTWVVRRCQLDP